MLKRLVSMLVGIGLLAIVMILNNEFIFSLAVTIVALIGTYEFYNAVRKRDIRPIEWLGYLSSLMLMGIQYVSIKTERMILTMILPISLIILFLICILSNNKKNILDISTTIFGMIYVPFLLAFLIFTRQMENNGVYYVWFIMGGAWMTDTFAYMVGMLFGKTIGNHKFSKISPNKSIEGCFGGIIGCVSFYLGYTYYLHTIGIELNYLVMGIMGLVISIIAQIGDFGASAIKRYCKIKDYGSIMPGHGGVLDRFDSILLIAPLIYIFFNVL